LTDAPETHYIRSADGTNLAYQLSGDGPLDLVFVPGPVPIDLLSDDPGFMRLRRRLETFSRTVWFDARGMGASEGGPLDNLVTEIADADRTAVLDAVGFERPALVGWDPGMWEIHFSATHPERVSALVLINSYAHYVREDDYPWGVPTESMDRFVATVQQGWGRAQRWTSLPPVEAQTNGFEPGTPAPGDSAAAPSNSVT
jgi:pimeloyl-ACP methyl ester carboxylesterase